MTNHLNNTVPFAPVTREAGDIFSAHSAKLTSEYIVSSLHAGVDFAPVAGIYSSHTGRELPRQLFDLACGSLALISGGHTALPIHWDGLDFELAADLHTNKQGDPELFSFRWIPEDPAERPTDRSLDELANADTPFGQLAVCDDSGRFWYQAAYLSFLYSPEFFTAVLCGAIEEAAYYIKRLEECRI